MGAASTSRLRLVLIAVLAAAWLLAPASAVAQAGEPGARLARVLVMVEAPGCPYCERFHREVGPAYPRTPEGRFAPLLRRPMGHPDLAGLSPPIRFSPTFVLMSEGREIGRITGYPGQDFFWPMLEELLGKAGFRAGG